MELEQSHKVYSSLSLLCFNLFIASLILVACSYFSVLVLDMIVNADILFGAGMLLGFLALVFWEKSKGKWNIDFHREKQKQKVKQITEKDDNLFFRVVPYFFLLMLLIIAVNQFFKWDFVTAQMMRITILAITFGAVTFWRNRERVEKEIENEKVSEEKVELTRASEFEKKFPRISRIWGLRSIVKWMYKEGWWYSVGLIAIVILYLFVQFSMFQYSGNYPDEYYHILTGKSLLETGNFPVLNNGGAYLRGAPISVLVALFFLIGGKSLFVAKLVPIFLGFVSLILLILISKDVLFNKKTRYILLLMFIFSSWLIFNHFYIRHYVFLEFSLISLTYAMIKLANNFSKEQWKSAVYFFLILFINILNYYFMNDSTKYLIPFATLFGFVYLFLFESHKFDIKQKYLKNLFHLNFSKKILIIALIFIILLLSFFSKSIVADLLYGETNTGANHFDFNSFFFGIYLFFTVFFILGLLGSIFFRERNKITYILIIPLLILHYFSSESLQIMRVMVYLLPIFYLGVCYGLEKVIIVFSKKRVIALILIILFIITTISTLQGDKNQIFSNGYPAMPGEIGYHEYQPMYDYLKTNLSGYITIYTEYEDQAEVFFNAKVDYEIDFKHVLDNYYSLYYDNETQRYRQFYTNTPVINNRMEYDSLISNNKTCVILKPYANHFLENSDISNIKNTLTKKVSFIGFEVYCNDL